MLMKLEVIDRSREESIATYVVPELSMLSFQQWKDLSEVVIPLNQLLNVVADLSSIDLVTEMPISVGISVDFYLPGPLKDRVLERLTKHRMDAGIDSSQFADPLREITEQACTPPLELSIILSAVAEELSRNHLPNDDYKVRISDE
jgi:hypothetical protein